MPETLTEWEPGLDQPGSAGRATVRRGVAFSAVIVFMAILVAVFGHIQLTPFPQFTTFHATFVFVVDAIAAFLLFELFATRRTPSMLVLGVAFLFSSLAMAPFLLTFPGALKAQGEVAGGLQSAIWIWHCWHVLFPAIVILSLLMRERAAAPLPEQAVSRALVVAITAAVLLVALVTVVVTVFHDQLPVLIQTDERVPFKPNFFWASAGAIAITLASFLLALRAARQRSLLHVWLSVVLLAMLADELASVSAFSRYSLGWYMGRVDAMLSALILLLVFLADTGRLYRRVVGAIRRLYLANDRLAELITEKDGLVAELQRREEQIRHMAYHDPVTGLANRRLLMDELGHILAQAKRHGHVTALLFIDLDKFKQVNDTLGHDVGDVLLREVGSRLQGCVRAGDIVARLGGDEFVIVLPEIAGPEDAVTVAAKALQLMREPVYVTGQAVRETFSIGIAISAGTHYPNAEAFLREADVAMYAAKGAGCNQYRFSERELCTDVCEIPLRPTQGSRSSLPPPSGANLT